LDFESVSINISYLFLNSFVKQGFWVFSKLPSCSGWLCKQWRRSSLLGSEFDLQKLIALTIPPVMLWVSTPHFAGHNQRRTSEFIQENSLTSYLSQLNLEFFFFTLIPKTLLIGASPKLLICWTNKYSMLFWSFISHKPIWTGTLE